MKISELITILQNYNPDAKVVVCPHPKVDSHAFDIMSQVGKSDGSPWEVGHTYVEEEIVVLRLSQDTFNESGEEIRIDWQKTISADKVFVLYQEFLWTNSSDKK